MVEKDLYTFRLPVDLMRQIDKKTNEKSDFVAVALKAALRLDIQPSINVDEKSKNHAVNYDDEFLNRYIDRLESDLEFWKDKYEVLQLEYYDQVRDSIKRLDAKVERIMYSIDESKNKPVFENNSFSPKITEEPTKTDHNTISQVSKDKNSDFVEDNEQF